MAIEYSTEHMPWIDMCISWPAPAAARSAAAAAAAAAAALNSWVSIYVEQLIARHSGLLYRVANVQRFFTRDITIHSISAVDCLPP